MSALSSTAVPDLVEGVVPPHLPDAAVRRPLVEAAPDEVLIRVPPVGRFLVRAGEPVLLQRAPGATDADVRCFLEGTVAAAAAMLRGLIPLRAATVAIGGRAVAIAGHSAAGKSTLVAALALRGHPVLADAVTPVATPDGRAVVEPLAAEPVLWPDMIEALGLDPEAGRPVRPALAKRAFRLGPEGTRAPLATVILLDRDARRTTPGFERLDGTDRFAPLLTSTWHRPLAGPLGLSALRFASLSAIASTSDCLRLRRPDHGSPTELAVLVEEAVG